VLCILRGARPCLHPPSLRPCRATERPKEALTRCTRTWEMHSCTHLEHRGAEAVLTASPLGSWWQADLIAHLLKQWWPTTTWMDVGTNVKLTSTFRCILPLVDTELTPFSIAGTQRVEQGWRSEGGESSWRWCFVAAPTFALFAGIRTRHPARCMPLLAERRGEGQELLGGVIGLRRV
jgi:hypothetical protein